jgi:hypothetical protein
MWKSQTLRFTHPTLIHINIKCELYPMIPKCWPNKYWDLGRHHRCLTFYKHTSYDWKLSSPKSKRSSFLKDFNPGGKVLLIVYVRNQPVWSVYKMDTHMHISRPRGIKFHTHTHTHIIWVQWTWEFSCELPFNHRLTMQGYGGVRWVRWSVMDWQFDWHRCKDAQCIEDLILSQVRISRWQRQ